MAVKPIPDGYSRVTPYLIVHGVSKLIEFLKRAFGAEETHSTTLPDGTVMHAELRIGGSPVMMGEARGEWKPMPACIYLYVEDADATFRRAIEAGARSIMEPADQFHGDRYGGVEDPVGNYWWIATHIEDVPPDEMKRREKAFVEKMSSGDAASG